MYFGFRVEEFIRAGFAGVQDFPMSGDSGCEWLLGMVYLPACVEYRVFLFFGDGQGRRGGHKDLEITNPTP